MINLAGTLPFFAATDRLKEERRACWIFSERRRESVAEHVWHATLLALINRDIAPDGTDPHHVRDLLTVHDLVEVFAGDTSTWDDAGNLDAEEREWAAGERLVSMLPEGSPPRARIDALWREFQAQETIDAQYARAIDSIHPMINSWSPGAQGHPLDLTPDAYESSRKRVPLDRFPAIRDASWWLIGQAIEQELMPASASRTGATEVEGDASTIVLRTRFMTETDALKTEFRSNHVLSANRRESVSEHCWHVTLLAMLWADIAPTDVDIHRVLDLLVTHDLAEVYAGDVPVHLVTDPHAILVAEEAAAAKLLASLPDDPMRKLLAELIDEYLVLESADARFARAIDVMHPVLMTWGPGSHVHPDYAGNPPSIAPIRERKLRSVAEYPALVRLLDDLLNAAIDRGEARP